jgi:hypothetical protein
MPLDDVWEGEALPQKTPVITGDRRQAAPLFLLFEE